MLVCAFGLISSIGYKAFRVDGDSMAISYGDGDKILVNKVIYDISDPDYNDIIVFIDPDFTGDVLVKRVIGLPGDSVEIKNGEIYINEKKVADAFSNKKITGHAYDEEDIPMLDWETGEHLLLPIDETKITVPDNFVWVIGDNREISWYGLVRESEIIGKVIL